MNDDRSLFGNVQVALVTIKLENLNKIKVQDPKQNLNLSFDLIIANFVLY